MHLPDFPSIFKTFSSCQKATEDEMEGEALPGSNF